MSKIKKSKIQTIIFQKRYYPTKLSVRNWLKRNPEYKLLKYKRDPIDKFEDTYRVRQKEPWYFDKKTFRTIKLNKSGTIKAVIGKLK